MLKRSDMPKYRSLLVCLVVIAIEAFGRIVTAADAWSVQTLNDNKPWDKYVDPPIRIRVEGRMGAQGSSQSGGSFRLLRCDLKFNVDSAKLRTINAKHTVEVTGYFKKVGARQEFEVEDVKAIRGYAEQFDSSVSELTSKFKRATPEDWTELGDRVAKLSRFYDDAELMKKANTAYSKSIEIEYESLKPTDAEGRFSLAKKVDHYKLSNRRQIELVHEGLHVQWQTLRKSASPDVSDWQKFASSLSDHLTGTQDQFKNMPRDLQEAYEQDPVGAYRKASDELRVQLHRLFFILVMRTRLLHDASDDGRDGDMVADRIEATIPEESTLAEKHRVLCMEYRLSNIDALTRAEIEKLASSYRDRKQDETAKLALLKWIRGHELRLKGDGVIGMVQLADEYFSLLNNEPVAVEYLSDAYKIDPTFEEIKTRLAALGYQWRNGRWLKSAAEKPGVPTAVPQSPTKIAIGMTTKELRNFMGQPGSLARAITAKGVTEVWSFGPPGSSRLVVRLEQKGRDQELKVSAITNAR